MAVCRSSMVKVLKLRTRSVRVVSTVHVPQVKVLFPLAPMYTSLTK
jgi:hypothetical protein